MRNPLASRRLASTSWGVVLAALLTGQAALAQDCQLPSGPLPTETRTMFLLDTSASMRGEQGGPANIFASVKAATRQALAGQRLPGRVELANFDAGLRDVQDFRWPQDAAKFGAALDALQAEGRSTWLYRSLEGVLGRLRQRPESATTVYVLTDGRNNDPQAMYTMQRALAAFERKRGAFDRLYYVALGASIPPEARQALTQSGYASGIELPAGQAPDLSPGGPLLPAMLEVGPGQTPLLAGQYTLDDRVATAAGASLKLDSNHLRLSGATALPADSTALLCRQGAGGSERALLRLRSGTDALVPPAPGASGAGVDTGLSLLSNVGGELRLPKGGHLDLSYELGGATTRSATLSVPDLPAGVVGTLNGQDAAKGVTLHGGERATLSLRDIGASGSSVTVVPRVNGAAADSASVLVLLGQGGAAGTAGSPSLQLLNPGSSGTLRPGQSVTWRYRVDGGPATIQALRSPAGTRATLDGARIGTPIPSGGEFAVKIINDRLQESGTSPQVLLTSGSKFDLPALRPASVSGGALWPWLIALLVAAGLLAWWLARRRAAPAAATALRPRGLSVEAGSVVVHGEGGARRTAAFGPDLLDLGPALNLPDLDGLKLEGGEGGARLVGLPPGLRLTERGRTVAVGDPLRPDLVYAFASGLSAADSWTGTPAAPPPPVSEPMQDEPQAARTPAVVDLPPVVVPIPPSTPVIPAVPETPPIPPVAPVPAVDDHFAPAPVQLPSDVPPVEEAPVEEPHFEDSPPAAPSALVVAPVPEPVPTPAPSQPISDFPPSQGADFGQLSQDIATLGILGGVGGLGVPRELVLQGDQLVLRGDEDEEPQELPEGHTDLGEAFGIPAMQGFAVERSGDEVRLAQLPSGFWLHSGGAMMRAGTLLPAGAVQLEVPASLRATVDRVREALGHQVDTRDAGIDLSNIQSAIDLDNVFGDLGDGSKH